MEVALKTEVQILTHPPTQAGTEGGASNGAVISVLPYSNPSVSPQPAFAGGVSKHDFPAHPCC